jgi:hypothetical protein
MQGLCGDEKVTWQPIDDDRLVSARGENTTPSASKLLRDKNARYAGN